MYDHLLFDKQTLSNGATIYSRSSTANFTVVYLMLPVGSGHCDTSDVQPGTAHFLEHALCHRSQLSPGSAEFDYAVGLTGGWTNAHTHQLWTTYEISVPNRHLTTLLPRFCSRTFEPVFTEEDCVQQRGIIRNEREQERWWPGQSEISRYLRQEWQVDEPITLKQLFGNDEDLNTISPEILTTLHQHYFDQRLTVLTVGSGDISVLKDYIEHLVLDAPPLEENLHPLCWKHQNYHQKSFQDTNCYELIFGGIINGAPDQATVRTMNFILRYLTNSTHGTLWEWLRTEKGWIYEINWGSTVQATGYDWTLQFNLNEIIQVETVRNELWKRVESALKDTGSVTREVDRIRDTDTAYSFETVDSIIESAEDSLLYYGHIYTETECNAHLELCKNITYLLEIFSRYFNTNEIGSFCAVKKDIIPS